MNWDEQVPGMARSSGELLRKALGWVAVSLVVIAVATLVLLLAACSDNTGPTPPDTLRPEFQKVAPDGIGGGGGGGGHTNCTRPDASWECALKFGILTVAGGGIAGCTASIGVCAGLVPTWGLGAHDYINTPDCRSCGYENNGYGTGRSVGPTNDRNLPPGSPPDTGGW